MKRTFWSLLFVFYISFLFASSAQAVHLSIKAPAQLNSDPFSVDVIITGASAGQNYIRVDLYKDQTSHYFGETFNGNDWIDGSDGKMYFPILIASSQAQVSVQARLGSPSLSEYPGSGLYKLKVRRYTASGAAAGSDTSTPLDVDINYFLPTPTLDPTNTPRPTPIKSGPSKIPTPTKSGLTPIKNSLATSTPSTTTKVVLSAKNEVDPQDDRTFPTPILGQKTEKVKKAPVKTSVLGENKRKDVDYLPLILLGAGGGFMAICAIIMYRNWRKNTL